MKHHGILFLLALFLAPLLVNAQTLWTPETGVEIRATHKKQPQLVLPGLNQGESLIVWSDSRDESWNFYGQLMNGNGEPAWEIDGRPIVVAPGTQSEVQGLTSDDGWILLWLDNRGQNDIFRKSLYMQRFADDGTPLWSQNPNPALYGVRFFEDNRNVAKLAFLSDGMSHMYIAADTRENGAPSQIRIFRVSMETGLRDANWPGEGVLLEIPGWDTYRSISELNLLPDRTDGVLVVWQTHTGTYMQRVGSDGAIRWTTPTYQRSYDTKSYFCSDGYGGAFIAWTRTHGFNDHQIRANRIFLNGSTSAGIYGIALDSLTSNGPELIQFSASLPGSAIILCHQGLPENKLIAQRIGGRDSLEVFWDARIEIQNAFTDQYLAFASDLSDGLICVYGDQLPKSITHFTAEGAAYTIADLQLLSSKYLTVGNANGQVSIVYQDDPHGIRIQNYDPQIHELTLPQNGTFVTTTPNAGSGLKDNMFIAGDFMYSYWIDGRGGPYCQISNTDDGSPLLALNGVPALPEYVYNPEYKFEMLCGCMDEDSNLYLAASKRSRENDIDTIVLQKISSTGIPLWDGEGVTINQQTQPDHIILDITLAPDENGGVYMIFRYRNYDNNYEGIAASWLDADGNPLWHTGDEDLLELGGVGEDCETRCIEWLIPGEVFLLLYRDAINMHVSKRNISGDILWTTDAQPMGGFPYPLMKIIDDQILLVYPARVSNPDPDRILGELLDLDGNSVWPDQPLLLADCQHLDDLQCSVHGLLESGSFWIAWSDVIADSAYAKRINLDGSVAFDNPIRTGGFQSIQVMGLPDGSAYMCADQNSGNLDASRLVSVHISADGLSTSEEYNFDIQCYNLFVNALEPDGSGGAILQWNDDRYSSVQVYGQRLSQGIALLDVESKNTNPEVFALDSIYPNPFNASATVTVTLPTPGDLTVSLFNVLGQEVMTLAHGPYTAGTHTLTVDGSSLASGIYFVRAEIVDGTQAAWNTSVATRKLVVLK